MDRESTFNYAELDVEAGRWYLVQTNYDRDLPDPKDDPRRTVAEKAMDKIGQKNMTWDGLFKDVLSLPPVLNDKTIESVVFPAYAGYFNITVWSEKKKEDDIALEPRDFEEFY
mmetsp:Transcript_63242/g.87922  ORF Transcript_63242/g.87922 Transcript_63242/m.87922 type:complete len:113 (-) Transcript_63242:223-561(-)